MTMAVKYAMKKRQKMYGGGEPKPVVDPDKAKAATESMRKAFRFAKGGDVTCKACEGGQCMEHGGLVDRVMAKRMAKGGEVKADQEPNEFDELELEPAPSPPHSGEDYGDDLGNEEMDENDRDLISRIMRSRAKKDRMPRPA